MSGDQLVVKKEKCSSSLPPKRPTVDLTVKILGSRKRKTVESTSLSLESLGTEEALQKLVSFSHAVSVDLFSLHFSFCFLLSQH